MLQKNQASLMRRLLVDLELVEGANDSEEPKFMNFQYQMRKQMLEIKFRVDQIIKSPTHFV
jgi:hypothetical protein